MFRREDTFSDGLLSSYRIRYCPLWMNPNCLGPCLVCLLQILVSWSAGGNCPMIYRLPVPCDGSCPSVISHSLDDLSWWELVANARVTTYYRPGLMWTLRGCLQTWGESWDQAPGEREEVKLLPAQPSLSPLPYLTHTRQDQIKICKDCEEQISTGTFCIYHPRCFGQWA